MPSFACDNIHYDWHKSLEIEMSIISMITSLNAYENDQISKKMIGTSITAIFEIACLIEKVKSHRFESGNSFKDMHAEHSGGLFTIFRIHNTEYSDNNIKNNCEGTRSSKYSSK
jgi:hypothetical protein